MGELDNQRRKLMAQIAKKNGRRKLVSPIASKEESRITIRETDDGLGIYNPSRHFMPVIIFLLLWLGGWGVGEFFALYEIFSGSDPFVDMFLIIWVTAWTFGGLAAWSLVLWQMFGVERLFITNGAVVREAGVWMFRRRRIFPAEGVDNFRLVSAATTESKKGRGSGAIAFDVAGETQKFGIGMSDEEAQLALTAIRRHLKARNTEETLNMQTA